MTEGQALRRASMWIGVLLKYAQVKGDEISMEVLDADGSKRRVSLSDDIAEFDKLGAPIRQEIWLWGGDMEVLNEYPPCV